MAVRADTAAAQDGLTPQLIYRSPIVHWNTVYVARIVGSLKGKGRNISGHLLKHVSPISWEHINLTGIYSWRTEPTDPTSFRPLREEKSASGQAA